MIEDGNIIFLTKDINLIEKKYCEGKVKRIKRNNLKESETYCYIS